jgi:hypothetical protein
MHRELLKVGRSTQSHSLNLAAVIIIMSSDFDHTLTNLARPMTSAVITVRVIKSLEFRTERSLILRDINLETTTIGDLKEIARSGELSGHILVSFFKYSPGCQ